MRNWNIRSKIVLLALLPTLIISILFAAFFISQKFNDVNTNLTYLGNSMIEQLEPVVKYALATHNDQALQSLADTTTGNLTVLATSIFDKNGKLVAYSGSDSLMAKNLKEMQIKLKMPSEKYQIFLQPLVIQPTHIKEYTGTSLLDANNSAINIGWIGLTISTSISSYIKTQTILVISIIMFIGILIALMLIRILSSLIIRPLNKINNTIKSLEYSKQDYINHELSGKEFSSIMEGLGKIKNLMHELEEKQQDNQSQEAKDLKQTLEEIEIHNIELNIALKNAQRDNQKKSEFIASLSHEIRTPMSSIIGFTNLLLESELTKYQQEYLITIQKSANTLLAIINDILDFSKIEAGKFKLANVPFDFVDTLDEVLQSLAPEAQSKHLEIIPLISSNIPPKMLGDPLRLKQILTNLVFNAIKFTEEGSVFLKAKLVDTKDMTACVQFSVVDTGIGLSEESKKNLFKAFSQADISIARKFGGTGLGLVISKQFIEQMGGHIEIHSKIGIGTTIRFNLNFALLSEAQSFIKINRKINKSILIYDSHFLSRKSIKESLILLVDKLVIVDTIDRLKTKLAMLKKEDNLPHRIILSLSTFELHSTHTKELLIFLKDTYSIPITALINTANETIINDLIYMGVSNCVVKPISTKKLLSMINEAEDYNLSPINHGTLVNEPSINYSDCSILVAEDNPTNLKLISSLLENLGIIADTAIDGKLACDACDIKKYSLIFLDLQMPIMGGYKTAENIRNYSCYNQSTPLIAISAYISDEDKSTLCKIGFNEFLIKPIDVATLQHVINKWNNKIINDKTLLQGEGIAIKNKNLKNSLPLDLERAIQLAAGNKSVALEIIQMFMKEIPILTEQMQTAYISKHWKELRDIIHKIRGTSSFCAMTILQKTSAEFENALINSSLAEYEVLYERIMCDIRELQTYLENNLPEIVEQI